MAQCAEEQKLVADVQILLAQIIDINKATIEAVSNHDHARIHQLDKDLEQAVGAKERAMGAWQQHRREHGC